MAQCDRCDDEAQFAVEDYDWGPRECLCPEHAHEFINEYAE